MSLLLLLLACGAPPAPSPDGAVTAVPEAMIAPPAVPEDSPVELLSAAALATRLAAPSTRPRVVNFWATWCAPCVEELPRLRYWGRGNANAELVLVNVDLARLHAPKVLPFVKERDLAGFPHFQLDDKDPAIALQQAVPEFQQIVPFTLVIAADGSHRTAIQGAVEVAQLEQALAGL